MKKSDVERAVPGAAQLQADPLSIAARGCRGREEPADSEPAKPAEPPNLEDLACSRANASRDVPAARKRRLTTSGMSAGESEVAATQEKSQKRGSGADDGR